jgi:hypothetical protein
MLGHFGSVFRVLGSGFKVAPENPGAFSLDLKE